MRRKIIQIAVACILVVAFIGSMTFVSTETANAQSQTSPSGLPQISPGPSFCWQQRPYIYCHETLFVRPGRKDQYIYERLCKYLMDNRGRKAIRVSCTVWETRQSR